MKNVRSSLASIKMRLTLIELMFVGPKWKDQGISYHKTMSMNFIISDNILDALNPSKSVNISGYTHQSGQLRFVWEKVRSSTVNKLRDDLDKIGFLFPIVTD